jgi:ABC-type transport system involved in multi-copper enzyme maturation permease subunit
MTFLPIASRELRVASRKKMTYWLRAGAVFSVLVIGTWFFLMLSSERAQARETAEVLFGLITGVATLYGLISGVRETADCLSSEKREGTLGLLFLTDLKGYDVVAGKFIASSLNSFYGIIAIVPTMAIPLLMGGITFGQFSRIALVALNAMFFSLSVGICVSSMVRNSKKASITTFFIVLVFNALGPAAAQMLRIRGQFDPSLFKVLTFPSTGYTYFCAWEVIYRVRPEPYWWSLATVNALGWFSLFLASVAAPRSWQDRPAGRVKTKWRERWCQWTLGTIGQRRHFRAALLDRNAFYWLASRVRIKPALVWAVIGLMACGWAYGLSRFKMDWLSIEVFTVTAFILNGLIKVWVCSEAPRQLAEDRRNGALELIVSTPASEGAIITGQFLALGRQFLGPLILALVLSLIFMQRCMAQNVDPNPAEIVTWWIGSMVTLVVDVVAIGYVGMWQGLTARHPNRAAGGTAARVLVMPGAIWAVMVLGLSAEASFRREGPNAEVMLVTWFVLGLIVDIILIGTSRVNLLTKFRTAAAARYNPGRGFWARILNPPQ